MTLPGGFRNVYHNFLEHFRDYLRTLCFRIFPELLKKIPEIVDEHSSEFLSIFFGSFKEFPKSDKEYSRECLKTFHGIL